MAGYPIVVALSPRPIVLQYFGMVPHVRAKGIRAGGEWTDVRRSPHPGQPDDDRELRGIIEVDGIVVTGTADDLTYDKSRLTHVRGIDASAQISLRTADGAGRGVGRNRDRHVDQRRHRQVHLAGEGIGAGDDRPRPGGHHPQTPRWDHGRIRFTVLRAEVFGAYVLADFVQMFVNRLTLNLDALTESGHRRRGRSVRRGDRGGVHRQRCGGRRRGIRLADGALAGWADSDTADGPDPEDRAEPMAG